MKVQAENLTLEYQQLGFHHVRAFQEEYPGSEWKKPGYVLSGEALIDGRWLPFNIRSPREAAQFAKRFGVKDAT